MNQCPVCRVSLMGNPDSCAECGTPIRKNIVQPWIGLNLVLPGITYLWKGWLVIGSVGIFGSVFSIGVLTIGGGFAGNWLLLGVWTAFWIPWALGWTWFSVGLERRYVTGEYVSSVVIGLLLVGNVMISLGIVIALAGLLRF